MRAAPRAMLLLTGHLIARTHGTFLRAPALADAHAPQRGPGEVAAVLGKAEMRLDGRRTVRGSQTHVLVRLARVDDLPGVHPVGRVPYGAELAERLDELGTDHLRQERGGRKSGREAEVVGR